MDPELSAAIIAAFRDEDPAEHAKALRAFSTTRWYNNLRWLDASGLALYFLERVRALNIEEYIPHAIVSELQQRQTDNQRRTSDLFEEFVRINKAFTHRGLRYVNLKGFALVPDYCPDLSLRYQMDLDLLVDASDADVCREILFPLGYDVVARNRQVMELKTRGGGTPRLSDLYKARPQRVVELHLCDDHHHPATLEYRRLQAIGDGQYPTLSDEAMFVSQATHLLKHLRSEWTRISWLWELRHCVIKHRDDAFFWRAVRRRAHNDPQAVIAIEMSLQMAHKAFGSFGAPELAGWSRTILPEAAALWVERYGTHVLLADFPGSKLYLFLEQALCDGDSTKSMVRRRLFPQRVPAKFSTQPDGNMVQRVVAFRERCSYFLFRTRFHITSGWHYLVESRRWKKLSGNVSAKGSARRSERASGPANSLQVSRQPGP